MISAHMKVCVLNVKAIEVAKIELVAIVVCLGTIQYETLAAQKGR